ncbi:hypothetical protein T484DRAFT_1895186 [Baffinella frigidus]|nr:hypothetical protein T484DRAFT_1895186 [Cryptophyta sp. CCMP2293]
MTRQSPRTVGFGVRVTGHAGAQEPAGGAGVKVSSSQEEEKMLRSSSSKLSRRRHRGAWFLADDDPMRARIEVSERFLAGMVTTSTCVFHVTDREGFCWGVLSCTEGQTELRSKRVESLDTRLVLLVLLALLNLRDFGGMWRKNDTGSML